MSFGAYGVQETVLPRHEVILSAGTLASPQLLMLLGIGVTNAPAAKGIRQDHTLPGVDKNLCTHPIIRLSYTCTQSVSLLPWTQPPRKWLEGLQWLLARKDAATNNHMDTGLFVRTNPGLDRPDGIITLVPLVLSRAYSDFDIHGFENRHGASGRQEQGAVTLRSDDPADLLSFWFIFLEDTCDSDAFRTGVKIMLSWSPCLLSMLCVAKSLRRVQVLPATTIWMPGSARPPMSQPSLGRNLSHVQPG